MKHSPDEHDGTTEPQMNDMELAEEIERHLAPDAVYWHWEPSMADMEQIIAALRRGHEHLPVDLDHTPADVAEAVEMLRRAKELLLDSESMVRYWRDKERPPSGESGSATASMEQKAQMVDALYYELLYAVGNKYPSETRHQTALRYILNAEKPNTETSQVAAAEAEGGKG